MSQEKLDTDAETTGSEITQAGLLATLQRENTRLEARIEELVRTGRDQQSLAGRLAEAEAENGELRRRYAETALAHAVDTTAVDLGISPKAAEVFRSRFACEIDSDGQARITPDPAEVLSAELAGNPLLRESVEHGRLDRSAAAVVDGAAEATEVDPVELMSALDRSASRKAQFIARHGAQGFIDLAEIARRKGYRQ